VTTEYLSRVLQMLCQPLQGTYSSGSVTIRTTTNIDTATLEKGGVLVPILDDCEYPDAAVKVERSSATPDGSWPISTAGTPVAVTSLQGGAHVNLPVGTQLRFDDAPAGINELAVTATPLTGGTRLETFGALRQVRSFKDLGSQVDARSFFAAQLGEFPAGVLQWSATTPGDGSASPSLGVDQTRVGRGRRFYCHEWVLFIISSRLDSADRRKREGDKIRDTMLRILSDRTKWRGVALSNSNGIKALDSRLASVTPTAYVDSIRFCTWFALERTESRVFKDWLTSHIVESRPTSQGVLEIVNIVVPMTQTDDGDGTPGWG